MDSKLARRVLQQRQERREQPEVVDNRPPLTMQQANAYAVDAALRTRANAELQQCVLQDAQDREEDERDLAVNIHQQRLQQRRRLRELRQ